MRTGFRGLGLGLRGYRVWGVGHAWCKAFEEGPSACLSVSPSVSLPGCLSLYTYIYIYIYIDVCIIYIYSLNNGVWESAR